MAPKPARAKDSTHFESTSFEAQIAMYNSYLRRLRSDLAAETKLNEDISKLEFDLTSMRPNAKVQAEAQIIDWMELRKLAQIRLSTAPDYEIQQAKDLLE